MKDIDYRRLPPHDAWIVCQDLYDAFKETPSLMSAVGNFSGDFQKLTIKVEPLMPPNRVALMRKGHLVTVVEIYRGEDKPHAQV